LRHQRPAKSIISLRVAALQLDQGMLVAHPRPIVAQGGSAGEVVVSLRPAAQQRMDAGSLGPALAGVRLETERAGEVLQGLGKLTDVSASRAQPKPDIPIVRAPVRCPREVLHGLLPLAHAGVCQAEAIPQPAILLSVQRLEEVGGGLLPLPQARIRPSAPFP